MRGFDSPERLVGIIAERGLFCWRTALFPAGVQNPRQGERPVPFSVNRCAVRRCSPASLGVTGPRAVEVASSSVKRSRICLNFSEGFIDGDDRTIKPLVAAGINQRDGIAGLHDDGVEQAHLALGSALAGDIGQ